MNTAQTAITAATVAYLASLGAGLKVVLVFAGRFRVVAPPKQPAQEPGAAEMPAPVQEIAARREAA